jgi:type II secretory pathway component PulC
MGALMVLQVIVALRAEFKHRSPAAERAPPVAAAPPRAAAIESLFGAEPGAALAGADLAVADDLELTGTIATARPEQGFAILRRRGQPEHLYASGATLVEGGTLLEVDMLCAVVGANGSRRRLCLPTELGGVGGAALARLASAGGASAGAPLPHTAEQRRLHPSNVPSSRLTEFLHPRPVVVDEHIVGYAVAAIDGSSPLPGVPRGAIIRSINGVPLTEGKVAAQMFSSMTAASAATVVVQTGAGERTVVVDIEPLVRLAAASDAAP